MASLQNKYAKWRFEQKQLIIERNKSKSIVLFQEVQASYFHLHISAWSHLLSAMRKTVIAASHFIFHLAVLENKLLNFFGQNIILCIISSIEWCLTADQHREAISAKNLFVCMVFSTERLLLPRMCLFVWCLTAQQHRKNRSSWNRLRKSPL